MDGLEAVEIRLTELKHPLRVDAELYQSAYIEIEEVLGGLTLTTLGEEAKVLKKGIFDISADVYTNEGIPFVRISNLKEMRVDDSDIVYIPELENNKALATYLKRGDIILSKTGSPAASLVTLDSCNTSQDTVAVKLWETAQVNSYYLVVFLNTRYGYLQMQRWFTGNIQMHLNLDDCKGILVPVVSNELQNVIKNVFENVLFHQTKSETAYSEAVDTLLEHLGLKDWQPSETGISVESFSEAFGAERLDPEFYQPKFDELENIISAKEDVGPLGKFLVVNARGKQPNYEDDGVLVVNSKHVRTGKVIITDNRRATLEKGALTIRKGDVLINGTGVGTIGRCAPYLHDETALPDNHVTVLRTDELDPVYLSVYLNSPAGQLQVDKHYKGSSGQIELYPDQIANFYVWKAPTDVQEQIREKVEASYEAEQLSEQLLDLAKHGVELAIEKGEVVAFTWIEDRMSDLGFGDDASR